MTTSRVVFLPGASGDPAFWTPVATRLPPTLERVGLSLPGLGRVPADSSVQSLGDLVRRTVDAVGSEASLVAQSMGGIVALLAALARPAQVRRLVLAATSGGIDVRRYGARNWRPDYRAEYPNAAEWIFDASVDLTERLRDIHAPTLLLWGDADPISPVGVGRALAASPGTSARRSVSGRARRGAAGGASARETGSGLSDPPSAR